MIIQSINTNYNYYSCSKPQRKQNNPLSFNGLNKDKIINKAKAIQDDAVNFYFCGNNLRDEMAKIINEKQHIPSLVCDVKDRYQYNFETDENGTQVLNVYDSKGKNLIAKTEFSYIQNKPSISSIEIYNLANNKMNKYSYIQNRVANIRKGVLTKNGKTTCDKYYLYIDENTYKVYTDILKKDNGEIIQSEQYYIKDGKLEIYKKYGEMQNGFQETVERFDF